MNVDMNAKGPTVVATFLPERKQSHLASLVRGSTTLLIAHSWQELTSFIQADRVGIVIVDPTSDGRMNIHAISNLLRTFPSVGVVAYVTLDAANFRAIVELVRRGLETIVLHGIDDTPQRFLAALQHAESSPPSTRALRVIRPKLQNLPARLSDVIEDLFRAPQSYSTANDLADRAKISVARVYRAVHNAKLAPPKKLIVGAKVLQAASDLRDPGRSIADVARALGYGQPRILGHQLLEIFGIKPSQLRNKLTPPTMTKTVLTWLDEFRIN